MKAILVWVALLLSALIFSGCDDGSPHYVICDDNNCKIVTTYIQKGNCFTYANKMSCGEVRIYAKNGAQLK